MPYSSAAYGSLGASSVLGFRSACRSPVAAVCRVPCAPFHLRQTTNKHPLPPRRSLVVARTRGCLGPGAGKKKGGKAGSSDTPQVGNHFSFLFADDELLRPRKLQKLQDTYRRFLRPFFFCFIVIFFCRRASCFAASRSFLPARSSAQHEPSMSELLRFHSRA